MKGGGLYLDDDGVLCVFCAINHGIIKMDDGLFRMDHRRCVIRPVSGRPMEKSFQEGISRLHERAGINARPGIFRSERDGLVEVERKVWNDRTCRVQVLAKVQDRSMRFI
jgi:ligand-binding sensor domain-containing protein